MKKPRLPRAAVGARAKQLTKRSGKLRATTAAGIYAKALLVCAAPSGVPMVGASLAEDLIACDGLRQSLWPALSEDVGP